VVVCNFPKNKNFHANDAVAGYHFETGIQFTLPEETHKVSLESFCTTNLYSFWNSNTFQTIITEVHPRLVGGMLLGCSPPPPNQNLRKANFVETILKIFLA